MKERLTSFVCALGALALFLAMFMPGEEGAKSAVPRPTSAERGPNGYRGAMLWLESEHIATVSVRRRFDKRVAHSMLPATGNLLIVTLPTATTFKTEELRPLDSWVRACNTLLVLAALADEPDWALAPGRAAASALGVLTGLEFETVKNLGGNVGAAGKRSPDEIGARIAATARAFAQPQRATLVPNGPYGGYFVGVHTAVGLSDYPARSWRVKIPYDGFALSLARERQTGETVLWARPLGNGKILISGLGSLLTNRTLGLADNGRLLANIIQASLGPGGTVLFDDMHQGLAAAYDPEKFYADPRLYATVGILVALWFCWVLGGTKLPLAATRAAVPREAELVQATGAFLARVLTVDAGARGLFEHFFQRLRARLPSGHESDNPPWGLLDGHPGVAPGEVRQLKDWYAAALASRSVPLERLHNLMLKIDRHLAA